jgi:hypothetical protein
VTAPPQAPSHAPPRRRQAVVSVRPSTRPQVCEPRESTARPYGRSATAQDWGGPAPLVEVSADELGTSGGSAPYRHGLPRLVADGALGQVGIVLGRAIARRARNQADCPPLLQLGGLPQPLLGDAEAMDARTPLHERLGLARKGPRSAAELLTRRARLQGGVRPKAARGALATTRPGGVGEAPTGQVLLEPAQQGQETRRLLCPTCRQLGSASAVGRYGPQQGRTFPPRPLQGPHRGERWWSALARGLTLRLRHHPRSAGACASGRTRWRTSPHGGAASTQRPRAAWHAVGHAAPPGSISWAACVAHQERWPSHGTRRSRPGAARAGHAVLQGRVRCGPWGTNRATSDNSRAQGRVDPIATCTRATLDSGGPLGTCIPGAEVDRRRSAVFRDQVTPMAMAAALAVPQASVTRAQAADTLVRRQGQRAPEEAEGARRRLRAVEPDHRLVAQTWEDAWHEQRRPRAQANVAWATRRATSPYVLEAPQHAEMRRLATALPRLWSPPALAVPDNNRLVRRLLEDGT